MDPQGVAPKVQFDPIKSISQTESRLSSLHNIENFNFSDYEALHKVAAYMINHHNKWTAEEVLGLAKMQDKLEHRIAEIERNTKGIMGFFRSIFHRKTYAGEKQQLNHLMALQALVASCKAQPPAEDYSDIMLELQEEPLGDKPEELGTDIAHVEPLILEEKDEAPLQDDTPLTTFSPPSSLPSPAGIPPPPPPPGPAPVPPPPPGAPSAHVKPIESPEEKYLRMEKDRLERMRKRRADPIKSFYIEQSNAQELRQYEKEIAIHQSTLASLSNWISRAPEELSTEMKAKKATIEAAIQELEKKMKPTTKPVDKATLQKTLSNYKNEELKLIIGMAFDGKSPSEETPVYVRAVYDKHQALIDGILHGWDTLSATTEGKEFLQHQTDWKKFASTNLSTIIALLENRIKHPETEPSYQPIPYAERPEKKKGQALPVKSTGKASPSTDFTSELTTRIQNGGVQLKKTENPVKQDEDLPPKEESLHAKLMNGIQNGKLKAKLKKTGRLPTEETE